ncbi:1,5-anhydro-D-fructose reductase [Rhodobacteraceae bacterium THAF1]|nr:1,5-anhydro-D-fructose reductase [Palleronia sp. THAF1]VDC17422.1 1,5-anhydro-D-fructose reductase [Rhodobacteraceae bacterium THAF1]
MRHVQVAQECAATRIAAVVEPVAARRAELRSMGLNAVATLDDVPDETRAAILATPTQDHHASALACIDRGWPVIVEKPVAGTMDQATDIVTRAADRGVPLFTGHHRRCHPFSRATREALTQIGDVVGVQGMWSLRKHDTYYDAQWRRLPGAGPLLTNLTHELDLLRFFLGEIDEITALTSNARRGLMVEDTSALALRFESGALGSFLISDAGASPWSFESATAENPAIAPSGQDYLRFVGTLGSLEFPSLTFWGRSDPGEVEWSKPLTRRDGPHCDTVDPLLEQITRFAGVVGGAEDDVLCTGADGMKALEMTLAAALSAQQGRPVRAGQVPGDYTGV